MYAFLCHLNLVLSGALHSHTKGKLNSRGIGGYPVPPPLPIKRGGLAAVCHTRRGTHEPWLGVRMAHPPAALRTGMLLLMPLCAGANLRDTQSYMAVPSAQYQSRPAAGRQRSGNGSRVVHGVVVHVCLESSVCSPRAVGRKSTLTAWNEHGFALRGRLLVEMGKWFRSSGWLI